MSLPVIRSFLSPILFGRASQLDYIGTMLSEDDLPSIAIVSGEAGIGKSRLMREARDTARDAGYQVIEGNCFERDKTLPFSLLIDVLRGSLLSRAQAELESMLGDLGGELVKLVPELAVRCPSLTPPMALDAEQEKRRLFRALSRFFLELGRNQDLLIILEDLHWADETTLEFLLDCCRQISAGRGGQRIRLLITYRTEDAEPPLRHVLAELDRRRLATEMHLEQLTRAEMDAMVQTILEWKRPLQRSYSEDLFKLTEGNPFFVEEVLKSVHASKHDGDDLDAESLELLAVPRTVGDAVARRSQQLGPGAGHLLAVASVSGQRFDLDLIHAVTGFDRDSLLEQIKELIGAQFVVEEAPGQFRFRHALTREAVYSQLLSTERREYHRQLAAALEPMYEACGEDNDALLGDLAYHFYESGSWSKARRYSEQAGNRARERFSAAAAVQHLSRALEAARRDASSDTAGLLRSRAGSYEVLGEFNKALADLETALEAARHRAQPDDEWQALMALGTLWLSRDYGKAGEYLEAALTLANELGNAALVAHSLNRVGNLQMNLGDPPAALERHQKALAAFRTLENRKGIADTLDLLGMTSFHSLRLKDQLRYHSEAVERFRELGDRQGAISSLSLLAVNSTAYDWAHQASEHAAFLAAVAAGEQALRESREIGWRAGESFACYALGMALGARGDYDRALQLSNEGLAIAEDIGHSQWQVACLRLQGELELDLLAAERAALTLERGLSLAQETKSGFWTACLSACLSRALSRLGRINEAEGLLGPPDFEKKAVLTSWLPTCAHIDLALAKKDFGRAMEVIESIEARAIPDGQPSRLTLQRIEALLGLQRFAETIERIEPLLAREPVDTPALLLWSAHVLHGKLLTATGRRREASDAYARARVLIEEIAGHISDAALRSQFLARGTASLPRSRPAAVERRLEKQRFEGLTQREREVAALIAGGRSNREIAEALVLSERTVAVHISNTLAKLGYSSRVQIAAWATARGLAGEVP